MSYNLNFDEFPSEITTAILMDARNGAPHVALICRAWTKYLEKAPKTKARHRVLTASLQMAEYYLLTYGQLTAPVMCFAAATYGSLEILKYAHESGCPWEAYNMEPAIRNGHMACIEYMDDNDCKKPTNACNIAAFKANIEMLKFLHARGCMMYPDSISAAILGQNLECLMYVYEHRRGFDVRAYTLARIVDNQECYKYLNEKGYFGATTGGDFSNFPKELFIRNAITDITM